MMSKDYDVDMSTFKQNFQRMEARFSEATESMPRTVRWLGGLAGALLLVMQFLAGLIKF